MTNEELRKELCDDDLVRKATAEAKIMFVKAQAEAERISQMLFNASKNVKQSS